MREVIGGEDPVMPTVEGPEVTMEGIETKWDIPFIVIGMLFGLTLYFVC